MKKPGIAALVLADLKKAGGPGRMKDDKSNEQSAADDVFQAIKDDDREGFRTALRSFVKMSHQQRRIRSEEGDESED